MSILFVLVGSAIWRAGASLSRRLSPSSRRSLEGKSAPQTKRKKPTPNLGSIWVSFVLYSQFRCHPKKVNKGSSLIGYTTDILSSMIISFKLYLHCGEGSRFCHFPPVKSGNSTTLLPLSSDSFDNAPMASHVAVS